MRGIIPLSQWKQNKDQGEVMSLNKFDKTAEAIKNCASSTMVEKLFIKLLAEHKKVLIENDNLNKESKDLHQKISIIEQDVNNLLVEIVRLTPVKMSFTKLIKRGDGDENYELP